MKSNKALWIASFIITVPAIMLSGSCASSDSNTPAASTPVVTTANLPASTPAVVTTTPANSISPSTVEIISPLYADESNNGKELRMAPGNTLQVALDSNPTTGFKWELVQISDLAVLEKVSDTFEKPMIKQKEGSPPIVGAGGKEFWTFKALKPGTAVISMEYSRPWEGGEKGVNKFSLTVIVQ
jgi:inhibitor of cysteine peptidase